MKIMTAERKGIMIGTIINYLKENIANKNHKLAEQNLYDMQEGFDEADLFFKLAFMDDDKVEKIASLITK